MRQRYMAACALLDACVDFHERPEQGKFEVLRLIRAVSERAALRLFYAAALTPAVRHAAETRLGPRELAATPGSARGWAVEASEKSWTDAMRRREEEAQGALLLAKADLRRCLQCETLVHGRIEGVQAEFFNKLEQQFLINISAAYVLTRLLGGDSRPDTLDHKDDEALSDPNLIRRINRVLGGLPDNSFPLLRAEMLAFLGMCGDENARERLARIERGSFSGKALSLDIALFDAIKRAAPSFTREPALASPLA